jgi:hypothetical protein
MSARGKSIWHEVRIAIRAWRAELRRLNRAGLDEAALSALPPRARIRAVKSALARSHSDLGQCC